MCVWMCAFVQRVGDSDEGTNVSGTFYVPMKRAHARFAIDAHSLRYITGKTNLVLFLIFIFHRLFFTDVLTLEPN